MCSQAGAPKALPWNLQQRTAAANGPAGMQRSFSRDLIRAQPRRSGGAQRPCAGLMYNMNVSDRPRVAMASFAASEVAHRLLASLTSRQAPASWPAAPQADALSCAIKHVMRFQMAWLRRRGGAG
eukprot:tig00020556_g10995.t2